GTSGGSRARPRCRKRPISEDHRKTEHHVFDASVPTRFLTRRSRRDESAKCRPGQRARVVAEGETARVELLLQCIAVDTRLALADEVCFVDLEHAIERPHV